MLGCLGVAGVLLIGLILFLCIAVANYSNPVVEETAAEKTVKLTAESPRIAAVFDVVIFDLKLKSRINSAREDNARRLGPDNIDWENVIGLANDPYERDLLERQPGVLGKHSRSACRSAGAERPGRGLQQALD